MLARGHVVLLCLPALFDSENQKLLVQTLKALIGRTTFISGLLSAPQAQDLVARLQNVLSTMIIENCMT
jgi:hypothetical protein